MIALLTLTALASNHGYVAGDVVNVRSAPSADAPIVARLTIRTGVEADVAQDGFVAITVADRPAEHAIHGYVRSDLVTDTYFDTDTLLRNAEFASEADRQMWLDRAKALDPWNPAVIAYAGTPTEPIHVAICDGLRVWSLGRLTDDGFVADTSMDGSLATSAWYVDGEPLYSGRFATPFMVPDAAIFEMGGDGWSVGEIDDGSQANTLVLGGCAAYEAGTVFATAPLAPVETRPAGATRLGEILAANSRLPDRGGPLTSVAAVYPAGLDGTEVLIVADTQMYSCGDEGYVAPVLWWGWMQPGGAITGWYIASSDLGTAPGTGPLRWTSWNGRTVGFSVGSDGNSLVGTAVEIVDEQPKATMAYLRGYGC